jgi:HIV Tat-specific factor 1
MCRKLEWFEEGAKSSKHERTIIFKGMFTLADMDRDPGLLLDLKADLRSECEKLGEVAQVSVFDKHPDGVCAVRFRTNEAAAACVARMSGRFFAGRRLEVGTYDGRTRYDRVNTDAMDEETRLKRYGDWLEGRDTSAAAAAVVQAMREPSSTAAAGTAKRKAREEEEVEGSDDDDDRDSNSANDGDGAQPS